MNTQPVGIFDSGLGGLSVLQQVCRVLPEESILYVADSGHAPYGCKDEIFVEQRSRLITEQLIDQGAKLVVIACNTATASIIEKFRQDYGIPFVGVEPGIKPAVSLSCNGKIGVMATSATITSKRYKKLVERFSHGTKIYSQPCPGLADKVEEGKLDDVETRRLLAAYLQPLMAENIDTLVLGCTHYSFLANTIKDMVNKDIHLVDTSRAVAQQVSRQLASGGIKSVPGKQEITYFTTGSVPETQKAIKTLLHVDVPVAEF